MTMNPEPNDEQGIQKILALKRHEQPPPAFFNGFSNRVLDRIRTEPMPRPTWRERLSVEFYGVPLYMSLAGVAVCGLLVVGMISSLRVKPPSNAVQADRSSDPLVTVQPTHSIVPPPHEVTLEGPKAKDSLNAVNGIGGNPRFESDPVRATVNGPVPAPVGK